MIQFIEKQDRVFRMEINGIPHIWSGTLLWRGGLLPLPAKVKGSTLGWYTCGEFVSYNKLKCAVNVEKGCGG